jgi:hypothetical protein
MNEAQRPPKAAAQEHVLNSQFSERSFPAKEDAIEAKAFVDLHRLSPEHLRDKEHFECFPINGGCAISLPNAPSIGLNRVLGLGSVEDLNKAYNWIRRKAGNRFLQLNLDAASDEVRDWVQTKDLLEHGPGWAKLTRSGPSSSLEPPGSVRTQRVQVDEAPLFGSMMCTGFNFPPTLASLWSAIVGKEGWSCFFALDGETPIGTGAIYVSGRYAWLGGGTTLPEFRNRGVQKALIQIRTDYGISQGVSTFVVETEVPSFGNPNISYENLRKMGFRHAYDRKRRSPESIRISSCISRAARPATSFAISKQARSTSASSGRSRTSVPCASPRWRVTTICWRSPRTAGWRLSTKSASTICATRRSSRSRARTSPIPSAILPRCLPNMIWPATLPIPAMTPLR